MGDKPAESAEQLAYDSAGFVVRTGETAAVTVTFFCDSHDKARRVLRRVQALTGKRTPPPCFKRSGRR